MMYDHSNVGIRLMVGQFMVDLFEESGYERFDSEFEIFYVKSMPESILVFNTRIQSVGRPIYSGLPVTTGFSSKSYSNPKNGITLIKTSTKPLFLEMQNNTERMLEKIRMLISRQEKIGLKLKDSKLKCRRCNCYFTAFDMNKSKLSECNKRECFCSFYA